MSLDATTFESTANETLDSLMDALDEQLGDTMDVDLQAGILTLDLDAGGQYIINKHGPTQQIWMSSPKSGATHYAFVNGVWKNTRDDQFLFAVLESELGCSL